MRRVVRVVLAFVYGVASGQFIAASEHEADSMDDSRYCMLQKYREISRRSDLTRFVAFMLTTKTTWQHNSVQTAITRSTTLTQKHVIIVTLVPVRVKTLRTHGHARREAASSTPESNEILIPHLSASVFSGVQGVFLKMSYFGVNTVI